MNYGLYISASGALTNLYRQDVFANNLANSQTTGYKPDVPTIQPRPPESIEDGFGFELGNGLLDRLGGGVFAGRQYINFALGQFTKTDGALDIALENPNQFFAVAVMDPDTQQRQVYLTRDGRFATNSTGLLVTAIGGHPVLDADDQPIQGGAGPAKLDTAGRLIQNGEAVGRIQVAEVAQTDALRKHGRNLLRIDGLNGLRRVVKNPSVITGHLESSGSDPIRELMKMISATKAVTSNGNLIRYHDSMIDRAVNVLGRVVA